MKKERHPSVWTSLLFRYYVLMRLLDFLKSNHIGSLNVLLTISQTLISELHHEFNTVKCANY